MEVAAGALIGVAIFGALLENSNNKEKYNDEDNSVSHHRSYVPDWINDERLHIGDTVFDIDWTRKGG